MVKNVQMKSVLVFHLHCTSFTWYFSTSFWLICWLPFSSKLNDFSFSFYSEIVGIYWQKILSNVYESIETDSKKIWKLQRYGLVFEYYNKPFLPPPFVLFSFIIYLFKTLIRCIVERKNVPFLRKFYSPSNSYFGKIHISKWIFF